MNFKNNDPYHRKEQLWNTKAALFVFLSCKIAMQSESPDHSIN